MQVRSALWLVAAEELIVRRIETAQRTRAACQLPNLESGCETDTFRLVK